MLSPTVTIIGVLAGGAVALIIGAWTYLTLKRRGIGEVLAATGSGLATTLVASVVFIVLHVQKWFGPETSWGFSVFLGFCAGICQAVLYRGDMLVPRSADDDERGA